MKKATDKHGWALTFEVVPPYAAGSVLLHCLPV